MEKIILESEKFPESTRIEMPEMSYAQELLNVPIPFENRTLFLSEYSRSISTPVTQVDITKRLGITSKQAHVLIDTVEPPVISQTDDGKPEYAANTLEVIEEELDWMLSYDQLDQHLSAKSIGAHLHKKPEWVLHRSNEFGIYPKRMIMPSKRTAMGFEKTVILPLRHWILHHPPAGDWLTRNELMNELGKHQDWVQPRLEDLGFEPKMRIAHGHNIPTNHYPPEALMRLKKCIENQPQPAGDWLTVGTMFVMLGRDRKWVLKRVVPYRSLAQLRLDDFGREAVHYPPTVFHELMRLNEEELKA